MITAEIIKDTRSVKNGKRITTMLLTYPKFIHGEVMTHRMFSRNAASSRAIPAEKFIEDVELHPAMPVWFGMNKKGMQATEEADPHDEAQARTYIHEHRKEAVKLARNLSSLGLHKQIVNRYLEPWFHMRTLVTSTEWDNFFVLRCHEAAEPNMQRLADEMLRVYVNSEPSLPFCEHHLPFIELSGRDAGINATMGRLIKISVARCARLSYLKVDGGNATVEEDVDLYDRLFKSGHLSPFEHVAIDSFMNPEQSSGNFKGWRQLRQVIETPAKVDLQHLAELRGLI